MEDDGGFAASEERTAQVIIREHMQRYKPPSWGFIIYRCTYVSQTRWDDFLSALQADVDSFLLAEDDDLRGSLQWKVVEDQSKLDGATWQEARTHFDQWVDDELCDGSEGIEKITQRPWVEQVKQGISWSYEEKLDYRISSEPRHSHFIYVDEASLNSVLDHGKGTQGQYYITLVQTARLDPEVQEEDGEDVKIPETQEYEGYWQNIRQKIAADDLVNLYGSVAQGDWPEGFQMDHFGISLVCRL